MLFFLVRHGDPIYNPDSLTPLGHEQAKAISKRFATYGLDKIYASTSNRAMQTAEPTCQLLKKEAIPCEWAHEGLAWEVFTVPSENGGRTWAFYDQKTRDKFRSNEVRALDKAWHTHPWFKDENFSKGVARIDQATDEFFLSLGFKHDREQNGYVKVGEAPARVALFAHQGFGLAFLSSLLDIPYPMFSTSFDLSHSSMTVVEFAEKEGLIYPKTLQLANDSHLYREGILTGYNNGLKF